MEIKVTISKESTAEDRAGDNDVFDRVVQRIRQVLVEEVGPEVAPPERAEEEP